MLRVTSLLLACCRHKSRQEGGPCSRLSGLQFKLGEDHALALRPPSLEQHR